MDVRALAAAQADVVAGWQLRGLGWSTKAVERRLERGWRVVHPGVYALTHLWWRSDRTPIEDPYCPDQSVLDAQRERVLAAVDVVIPGHDAPFRVER